MSTNVAIAFFPNEQIVNPSATPPRENASTQRNEDSFESYFQTALNQPTTNTETPAKTETHTDSQPHIDSGQESKSKPEDIPSDAINQELSNDSKTSDVKSASHKKSKEEDAFELIEIPEDSLIIDEDGKAHIDFASLPDDIKEKLGTGNFDEAEIQVVYLSGEHITSLFETINISEDTHSTGIQEEISNDEEILFAQQRIFFAQFNQEMQNESHPESNDSEVKSDEKVSEKSIYQFLKNILDGQPKEENQNIHPDKNIKVVAKEIGKNFNTAKTDNENSDPKLNLISNEQSESGTGKKSDSKTGSFPNASALLNKEEMTDKAEIAGDDKKTSQKETASVEKTTAGASQQDTQKESSSTVKTLHVIHTDDEDKSSQPDKPAQNSGSHNEEVKTDKIDVQKINTQKIDAQKIDTQKIDTQKIDTQKIDTQKIDAQKIDAKKIDTQKDQDNQTENHTDNKNAQTVTAPDEKAGEVSANDVQGEKVPQSDGAAVNRETETPKEKQSEVPKFIVLQTKENPEEGETKNPKVILLSRSASENKEVKEEAKRDSSGQSKDNSKKETPDTLKQPVRTSETDRSSGMIDTEEKRASQKKSDTGFKNTLASSQKSQQPADTQKAEKSQVLQQVQNNRDATILETTNNPRPAQPVQSSTPPEQANVQSQQTAQNTAQAQPAAAGPGNSQQTSQTSMVQHYAEKVAELQEAAGKQIVRGVQGSIGTERSHLSIRLTPESLGRVHVQMTMENGTLSAQITASKDSTRALLNQSVNSLRTAFEDQGIKVDKLVINKDSLDLKQNDLGRHEDSQDRSSKNRPGFNQQPGQNSRQNNGKQTKQSFATWSDRMMATDYYM